MSALSKTNFPKRIQELSPHKCRFEAFKMVAEQDGCEIFFACYPAGTAIEPHTHATENWGIITKGEMIMTIEGKEHRFTPGDWYHIPANAEHSARCDVDTEEIEFWFSNN